MSMSGKQKGNHHQAVRSAAFFMKIFRKWVFIQTMDACPAYTILDPEKERRIQIMYKGNKGVQGAQSGQQPMNCGYPQVSPAQTKPTQMMPAQTSPTKQYTENVNQEVQIPMVHPSHTTQVNHTHYKYIHSYPHTQSVVNSASEEHVCAETQQMMPMHHCPPPCPPRPCPPRPCGRPRPGFFW
ncbi:CotD family spore coat protein [Rossellomorea marisflavi]|uniref:CotD family spore coat protein n=1 Tax=Rossellomorea marisflavi TaxID=189381 RepID=UPI003458E0AB